jgi:Virulence protein RhuM family
MNTPLEPNPPPKGQFLVCRTDDGQLKIDVRLEGETAWLTQAHTAELFQTTIPNVSMHLRNVYAEGELQAAATVKEFLIVRQEGSRQVSRAVEHYNLDAIISVGYRVKSAIATRFRIWATQKLREFIVKGFVLDDERLKNPDQPFDYFEELLRRIQDIRTSERRFYNKLPQRIGIRRPEQPRRAIPAFCRGPGHAAHPDAHARMDCQTERFPDRERTRHTRTRGQNLPRDSEGTCRGGIPEIPPQTDSTSRPSRGRFRPGHQTTAASVQAEEGRQEVKSRPAFQVQQSTVSLLPLGREPGPR